MAANELLLVDLFNLIYNLTWLVFLTHKHYGRMTTRAGHIFELNVLLNATIINLLWILLVDLELLPSSIMSEILNTANLYTFMAAIACSQIETIVFLKTLNVNTMMTNTAAKIILATTIFSFGLAVITRLTLSTITVRQSEMLFCDYLTPIEFYLMTIPLTVVLAIVLLALGFGVFRGIQIKRTRVSGICLENLTLDNLEQGHEIRLRSRDAVNDTPRLFTRQVVIPELDQVIAREMIEEDLVIQDIELASIETNFSSDHEMIDEIGCEPRPPREIIEEILDLVIQETSFSTHVMTEEIGCEPTPQIDILEEDLVIQDIELASIETTSSTDPVMMDEIGCVPIPLPVIMKTIQKYMRNTMLSLLILTFFILPWYSASLYGFITDSGCEDPNIKLMVEIIYYGWYIVTFLLPFLIKLKLDRLSK